VRQGIPSAPYDEAAADVIRIANLRLLHEFHEHGIDVDVPDPIPAADGRLFAAWRAGMLVCYDYVDGRPFQWTSASDSALLGRAAATIHRAAAELGDAVPAPVREVVVDLDALVAAVPELATEIVAVVARCAELDPRVRDANPRVLCHTDLTPWNLIVTPDGRLTVLDWDEAGMAPREQDLIFTLGAGSPGTGDVAAFWSGYRAAGGEPSVDFATLEWALLSRQIDDMMFDIGLLNSPEVSEPDGQSLGPTRLPAGWSGGRSMNEWHWPARCSRPNRAAGSAGAARLGAAVQSDAAWVSRRRASSASSTAPSGTTASS
jgi:Phosphotransferase enzyme family